LNAHISLAVREYTTDVPLSHDVVVELLIILTGGLDPAPGLVNASNAEVCAC
jgi:hypothetical protein